MAFLIAGVASLAFWWALAGAVFMGWALAWVLVLPLVVAVVLVGLAVELEEINGRSS